jgi:hypothetical protein
MRRLLRWLVTRIRGRPPVSRSGMLAIANGNLRYTGDREKLIVKVDGLAAFGSDSPPR